MSNRKDGKLYRKFDVVRTDGESAPGKRHDGCDYFVLDLTHDKFARFAIESYASACEREFPILAADIMSKVRQIIERDCRPESRK